ncbi:NAD(P)/FAD-dependent oxidoreductase [Pseudaminobacter soli (ex Li et al. 2025)]|uniref:D-amino-acid oxidase n=1 Tax=Pseudaminobacter soli (ex Li et al. 2025) TaxID=1295366 RepID=A0A2P7SNL2_9HYPH|nr:FAD-binding oxidoreductase [Mesorhizobium soli]PSJ64053.1 D-amino-acid oxidase [Mesorhizobium soli]
MPKNSHVVIVGAGIIGASLAWHLVRAGARVTIIEAGAAGGVATSISFGWLNASWGNPEPYFRLRIRSMAEWRRLEREVPGLPVSWSGGLIWDLPPDKLADFAREHVSWGYGIRSVDRKEAARLEPQLANAPEFALHVAEEGAAEPLTASRALMAAAVAGGAKLLEGRRVTSIRMGGHGVASVETDAGPIAADMVAIAAGVETPSLLATAGLELPLSTPPGMLVTSRPHRRLLGGLVMAPELHMRQTTDGRLVAGGDFEGNVPRENIAEAAATLFSAMQRMLRAGEELSFDRHLLGHRPVPGDGFPAVGAAPGIDGLYVAVMHSGMTLAPAIARFLADEMSGGRRDPLLSPYGLERFAQAKVSAP